ncbi:hypothetical protein HK405_005364, partial [Cladochytrium tenue]
MSLSSPLSRLTTVVAFFITVLFALSAAVAMSGPVFLALPSSRPAFPVDQTGVAVANLE